MNDETYLQVLRTIDKFDRIGREGVVALLQKPATEFGADLNPIQAELVGQFLDIRGETDEETLSKISGFFGHADRVQSRISMMVWLEDTAAQPEGTTAWDRLLAMPQNVDETWSRGGRPANIGWALDDLVGLAARIRARAAP